MSTVKVKIVSCEKREISELDMLRNAAFTMVQAANGKGTVDLETAGINLNKRLCKKAVDTYNIAFEVEGEENALPQTAIFTTDLKVGNVYNAYLEDTGRIVFFKPQVKVGVNP